MSSTAAKAGQSNSYSDRTSTPPIHNRPISVRLWRQSTVNHVTVRFLRSLSTSASSATVWSQIGLFPIDDVLVIWFDNVLCRYHNNDHCDYFGDNLDVDQYSHVVISEWRWWCFGAEWNIYKEDRKHAKQNWKNNIQINCEVLIANNFCVFCGFFSGVFSRC